MLNINENKHAAGQPNGKPRQIDKRMKLVFPEVAKGDGKVIFEHTGKPQ